MSVLSNKLSYYYTNLNSSIICLFSGNIHLSFGISLLASQVSECNSLKDLSEAFVILSAILLSIKSPVASAVSWIESSISNGWLFWSINHASMAWKSELNVFKKIWFFGEISNRLSNGLFGINVYKTLESCW